VTQRALTRQLRKQSLVLQARRYRLALRQDLTALAEPLGKIPVSGLRGKGPAIVMAVLSVLPNRWGRLLSIGMLSWRLVKRMLDAGDASPSG
jgi:hypothetical protein